MKRILLAILFIFTTCVFSTFAVEKVKIGDLYYNLNPDDRTAEVTLANNDIISLNIPATVEYNSTTFHVTGIRDYAFQGSNSLTFVSIPNSITHITGSAFLGCNNLKTPVYNAHKFVYLPRSYKGAYTIPEGIKTIAQDAFLSCKKLTSVTIPSTVRSIENKAFFNCVCLASVIIPNGVTDIEDFAFYGCITLNSVTIPNSVTNVGKDIFGCCDKLEKPIYNTRCFVSLPRSYKGVYKIPTGIESIAPFAFGGCSNLPSVKIPNSVTSIGESAFVGCSNLKEIHYPQGLDLSQAVIPSSTKLIAYDPTNSSTNATTTASSGSTSATNCVTSSRTAATQPSTPTTKPVSTALNIPTNRPICTILSPRDKYTYYSNSTISIRYKVENLSKGQTIEYYVDDPKRSVPIRGTKGVRVEQGTELRIDMSQFGTGKHVVGVRVVDAYGVRSEDTRTFIYRSVHKPTLHVFAIGVNKYKYNGEGFKDLKYAVDDAKDFSKTVINLADMDTYKQVDTTLLLDGAANRANLEEQLIELIGRVQADDVVMLFFSGHGVNINGDSYFLTSDAKDPLRGLSFHFINQRIKDMKSKGGHILIFMDACHSGGMGNAKGSSSKSITLAEPGAIGYYSCTENQTSIEKEELKKGVFTYALIEGMKGNKDGQQITMWGLYNSILEIVKKENKDQYPRLKHDNEIDNDYVIFYKKK